MSKQETWRTRMFWQEHRHVGRLHEEFLAIPGSKENGKRLIDGVILHGTKPEIGRIKQEEIEGAATELPSIPGLAVGRVQSERSGTEGSRNVMEANGQSRASNRNGV